MRLSVAESVYVPKHKLDISSKALEKAPGPVQDNVNGVALVTVVKISPSQIPKHETIVESSTTIKGALSSEIVT